MITRSNTKLEKHSEFGQFFSLPSGPNDASCSILKSLQKVLAESTRIWDSVQIGK